MKSSLFRVIIRILFTFNFCVSIVNKENKETDSREPFPPVSVRLDLNCEIKNKYIQLVHPTITDTFFINLTYHVITKESFTAYCKCFSRR